jgi:hypothetical protein
VPACVISDEGPIENGFAEVAEEAGNPAPGAASYARARATVSRTRLQKNTNVGAAYYGSEGGYYKKAGRGFKQKVPDVHWRQVEHLLPTRATQPGASAAARAGAG